VEATDGEGTKPREPPRDGLDFTDRHLTRATDDNKKMARYIALTVAFCVCLLALIGGIAVAFQVTGVPIWTLMVLGVGGSAATAVTLVVRQRKTTAGSLALDQSVKTEQTEGSSQIGDLDVF